MGMELLTENVKALLNIAQHALEMRKTSCVISGDEDVDVGGARELCKGVAVASLGLAKVLLEKGALEETRKSGSLEVEASG